MNLILCSFISTWYCTNRWRLPSILMAQMVDFFCIALSWESPQLYRDVITSFTTILTIYQQHYYSCWMWAAHTCIHRGIGSTNLQLRAAWWRRWWWGYAMHAVCFLCWLADTPQVLVQPATTAQLYSGVYFIARNISAVSHIHAYACDNSISACEGTAVDCRKLAITVWMLVHCSSGRFADSFCMNRFILGKIGCLVHLQHMSH